jgi:general secretion pathway protein A
MYEAFYGLSDAPFELTHRSKFLCAIPGHRKALDHLDTGLLASRPLTLLIGGPGLGKTTVLNEVSAANRHPHVRVLFVADPTLPPSELLGALFTELAGGVPTGTPREQVDALGSLLAERYASGVVTALAIDEAESLGDDSLQQLCQLAGIRTVVDTPLLPLILSGNASLRSRLNRPRVQLLAADRAPSYELAPLTLAQTASYILWRIAAAGGDGGALFTREAVALIHHVSQGIPRTISVICDNALMQGFSRRLRPVTSEVVADACRRLELHPSALPVQPRETALRATATA